MKYVIEHQSRGVYVKTLDDGRPLFKYSILRSEGKVFDTEEEVRERFYLLRRQKGCRGLYIFAWDPNKTGRGKYIYPKHL